MKNSENVPNVQGVPIPCAPPPQHNWEVPDPKPIYFLDPTSIPDLHARFQITNLIYLLPVTWFMMWDRGHFCEQNVLNFLGCYNENERLSIIGIDPYIIPFSKANILHHAVKLKLGYCHTCGLFSSHFNWLKVINQQLDFLKKCPDTLYPPYPAKLRSDIHKRTLV